MPKPRIQPIAAQFRELPGTQVGFWVVTCPFCGATHFHSAGARLADPMERLGQTNAPCGGGEYILVRPQEKRKKSKKARKRDWNEQGWDTQDWENSNFWEKQDWEDEEE